MVGWEASLMLHHYHLHHCCYDLLGLGTAVIVHRPQFYSWLSVAGNIGQPRTVPQGPVMF